MDRALFSYHKVEMMVHHHVSDVEAYTRFTKAFLRSYGDLRMLELVQLESLTAVEGLPSWVPDFSVLGKPHSLSIHGHPVWNAAKNIKWTRDSRELGDSLLDAQWLYIGSIEESTIMADETDDTYGFWESVVKIACELPEYYEHASDGTYVTSLPLKQVGILRSRQFLTLPSSKQTRAEALWRTIIRNSFAHEYPAPSSAGNEFFSWMVSIKARRKDWEKKDLLSIFKSSKSSPAERFGSFWLQLLKKEPANPRIDKERFQHLISDSKGWILNDARDAQV
jgi:hypothetical protein